MVEVTQEVREAAADYYAARDGTSWGQQYIRDGMDDDDLAVQALATIHQRGKLEGARLAIEAAIREADEHARLAWKIGEREGQSSICSSGRNYGARAVGQSIRALSPAKIVGEG